MENLSDWKIMTFPHSVPQCFYMYVLDPNWAVGIQGPIWAVDTG